MMLMLELLSQYITLREHLLLTKNSPLNGLENGRIAIAITENKISNVKSVYATSNTLDLADGITGINTFSANVIQSNKFVVGIATISPKSGGVSTVTRK